MYSTRSRTYILILSLIYKVNVMYAKSSKTHLKSAFCKRNNFSIYYLLCIRVGKLITIDIEALYY